MANVFNVPGVPSLPSYLAGGISLLTSDASLVSVVGQSTLQWGIFRLLPLPAIPVPGLAAGISVPVVLPVNPLSPFLQPLSLLNTIANPLSGLLGGPVLPGSIFPITASFVDVEYKQDWPVSDYPIEQGAFQSYDKVQLPFAIRMRLAVSGNAAILEAALLTIQNMASDVAGLYQIVTPSQIFTSCTVTHYDYRRTATSGVSLLVFDVWFIQVRQTATTSLFSNTANPAFAGQENSGVVQPQAPASRITQGFSAAGFPN